MKVGLFVTNQQQLATLCRTGPSGKTSGPLAPSDAFG